MSTLSVTLFFTLILNIAFGQIEGIKLSDSIQIVDKQFFFRDEPVHPKLIWEFTSWVSDEKPTTLSVDVGAAYKSNEYFFETTDHMQKIEDDMFWYEWLGKLDCGVHVIRTYASPIEGNGSFQDVLFVKFIDKQFDLQGKVYNQLVMELVKSYYLEDRSYPEIKVKKNKVVINKPQGFKKKVIIRF